MHKKSFRRSPLLLLAGILFSYGTFDSRINADEGDLDYIIVPGDLIRVDVYGHDDLSRDIRVPQDGSIAFPLLGDLPRVAGLSEFALRAMLKNKLEERFLRQAIVSTSIIDHGPRLAYVMGSVRNAGSVQLSPFSPMTAMQAISASGGFDDSASRSDVQVIRDNPENPGSKISLSVPTDSDAEQLASDIALQHNDIIVVPRLDRIYVIGRISRPGALNLPSDQKITVSKAVSMAGGFAKFARKSEVQLIRDGSTIKTIDVDALLNGDAGHEDPELEPGDTLYVPERGF